MASPGPAYFVGPIQRRGVYGDFFAPTTLAQPAKAPFVPNDPSIPLRARALTQDVQAAVNLLLAVRTQPLTPQEIAGILGRPRGLCDFAPPNLTLTLPAPRPITVVPAGRHGSREAADRRERLDVLRARLDAFKAQREAAEQALIQTEEGAIEARQTVLRRVRVRPIPKPVETYVPVVKAVAQHNTAIAHHQNILNQIHAHQLEAQRIERKIQEVDEEAALYLMHWLMMETEWDE